MSRDLTKYCCTMCGTFNTFATCQDGQSNQATAPSEVTGPFQRIRRRPRHWLRRLETSHPGTAWRGYIFCRNLCCLLRLVRSWHIWLVVACWSGLLGCWLAGWLAVVAQPCCGWPPASRSVNTCQESVDSTLAAPNMVSQLRHHEL